MCATGRELRLGLLHLTRIGCNSTSAYHPADPADGIVSTCVARVREVGHHRGNRTSMAAPADSVIGRSLVFAEPMHIRDQLLGRSSFTLIANIDDHQARTFDTLESLRHCPVLNGFGRRNRASRGDARQHLGAHVLADLWFLPKEFSNGDAHLMDKPAENVRSTVLADDRLRRDPQAKQGHAVR
jgi:hypothetical protein